MSGGSHEYAYLKVEQFISDCRTSAVPLTPLRKEFLKHLVKVAAAMQAIEWVDSGDCSPPHDEDAIKAALGRRL